MPHTPGLSVSEPSERAQQAARYDNLASWAHKVLTVDGKPQYSEAGLRRQLASAHVLDKEGTVNEKRMKNLMRSLGFKGKLPSSQGWARITEGDSP